MKNKIEKKEAYEAFDHWNLNTTKQEHCFHTKTCLEMLGMSLNKFTSQSVRYVLYDSTAYGCLTVGKISSN